MVILFVGLATLFAELLKPLAPSQAAVTAIAAPQAVKPAPKHITQSGPAQPIERAATDVGKPFATAVHEPPIPDGPLVAIILTELGPNAAAARDAIERLPSSVSLAFSPYADASRDLARRAKAGGHEIWLSVPMQPKSYPRVSPGKNALLTGESGGENLRRLEWALARVDAPVGVTNMMGSAFTEDTAAMRPVLGALKAKGLGYIDARSSGKSVGEAEAKAIGIPTATNDRFLDEPETAANIRRNLDDLVATARRRGHAVGYARPAPETIRQIEAWAKDLEAKGVTLVGASVVARKNSDG